MVVLGTIRSFLEPFCEHVSPKIDKVSEQLTLRCPHEGPCMEGGACLFELGHDGLRTEVAVLEHRNLFDTTRGYESPR